MTEYSKDNQRGDGLHPMPTSSSIGATSANSGNTIGPAFSHTNM